MHDDREGMPDRRHSLPLIGSSRLESDAEAYHRQQAAKLKTALTLAVCGVPILRAVPDVPQETVAPADAA